MSAAAKPQPSEPHLWMIWSPPTGYRTVTGGWAPSPKLAQQFSREAADAFIAASNPNALLLAVHYDPRVADADIRILETQPNAPVIQMVGPVAADLHQVALDTLNKLKNRGVADIPVEVVRHGTPSITGQGHLLKKLAQNALGELERRQHFTRTSDAALKRFDAALEAYRRRLHPMEPR